MSGSRIKATHAKNKKAKPRKRSKSGSSASLQEHTHALLRAKSVLGSFRHTRTGNAWYSPFAPLTVLLSLHLHYFSTPVLHEFAIKHCLPAGSQYFRTKCFPFAQHMYGHKVLPNTFIIYTWIHFVAVNQVTLNESCCLCMCHVTSEFIVFPWIHHVISNMSPLNASCYSASRYSA